MTCCGWRVNGLYCCITLVGINSVQREHCSDEGLTSHGRALVTRPPCHWHSVQQRCVSGTERDWSRHAKMIHNTWRDLANLIPGVLLLTCVGRRSNLVWKAASWSILFADSCPAFVFLSSSLILHLNIQHRKNCFDYFCKTPYPWGTLLEYNARK